MSLPRVDTDFLILGGGVAGLAAAYALGRSATVLEQTNRPGGLVVTDCFQGYWFDRVLHLLHVSDPKLEKRFRQLLPATLAPCAPVAWIECAAGTARYPIQLNLGALEKEVRIRCLDELARINYHVGERAPDVLPYDQFLLRSFGPTLCELFYFPYNRKMWKRPLHSMVASGQSWNILRPAFTDALRGGFEPNQAREAYNTNGYYPRPRQGAQLRGMEVLSQALAARVANLRLNTEVVELDVAARKVTAKSNDGLVEYFYRSACLCTIPLPAAIGLCTNVPATIRTAAASLRHNYVVSVAFSIRGTRPTSPGHWRYYADESIAFTRLIFMTEFDAASAPADGWGVMAELSFPGEMERPNDGEIIRTVANDLERVGVLQAGNVIIDAHVMVANPAYVVFFPRSEDAAEQCRAYLAQGAVASLGRYGRWEYSSMSQVIGDAIRWAETFVADLDRPPRVVQPS
jgi:protoporphyrinogen oxidase